MFHAEPYFELPCDAAMSGFLAEMTPARANRDLTAGFSRVERRRERHLNELGEAERSRVRDEEIRIALAMAAEMRVR